jgi:hypothetical protein
VSILNFVHFLIMVRTGAAEVSGVSDDDTLGGGPIVGYVVGAVGLLTLMMACVLASQKPATSAIMMDHERITA